MKKILQVKDPNVFATSIGAPVLHPHLAIIHFDEVSPIHSSLNNFGVYALYIQREFPENLTYGMKLFNPGKASIIALAPGQIGGKEDDGTLIPISGWALLWSPELLHGTDLEAKMTEYRYFSYFATESLQTTTAEWGYITQLLTQMRHELEGNADSPTLRAILLAYLRLILEYCNRIYLRQLALENKDSSDILKRFHRLLNDYYCDDKQMSLGVPSVSYCASQLAYSPRYLGDMIHKATGGTAIGYIHSFVIEKGKSLLMSGHNVSETSRLLGFEYVHHFNRIFKKVTGITPLQFLGK